MKQQTLPAQLKVVLWGFILLLSMFVGISVWFGQIQQNNVTLINLAGRQQLLAQQMTWLALTAPTNPELGQTMARFEQTLATMSAGGTNLEAVTLTWLPFRATLLQSPSNNEQLQIQLAALLFQLDKLVVRYETQAQANLNRFRFGQTILGVITFSLLLWGYCLVQRDLLPADNVTTFNMGAERPAGSKLPIAKTLAYQKAPNLTDAFTFSQEFSRQLESDPLLQLVANRACTLMGGCAASVCLFNQENQVLELSAIIGAGSQQVGLRQSTYRGLAPAVIHSQETVIANDGCAACIFLCQFGKPPCIAAPLQVGGQTLGAVCVVRPQRPFAAHESEALTLLANSAAIALENTRLITAKKRQAEEEASLVERERLATELHDHLAQLLVATHFRVEQLALDLANKPGEASWMRINEIRTSLQQAYAQVRLTLSGLREVVTDGREWATVIPNLLADFEAQSGLQTEWVKATDRPAELTAVAQKQVVQIIREALSNIRRHAQATKVQVIVTQQDNTLLFTISDDGIGFDLNRVNGQNHLGLTIMQTRVERSQGRLVIWSRPGHGTTIAITYPCSPPKEANDDRSSNFIGR